MYEGKFLSPHPKVVPFCRRFQKRVDLLVVKTPCRIQSRCGHLGSDNKTGQGCYEYLHWIPMRCQQICDFHEQAVVSVAVVVLVQERSTHF